MAGNIYGLDLGTYEIRIYDKKRDRIRREKNTVALKDRKYIFAAGDEAYEIYEKNPSDIQVFFPMKDGVIARIDDMQYLLCLILGSGRHAIRGVQYVAAVPTDITEVEKKAFYDLLLHSEAKARSVRIVERGIADALGCGVDVMSEKGVFVANFGGDTTELSVISRGNVIMNRLVKKGGHDCDREIVSLVRHNMEFLIGNTTAEMLRRSFGVFSKKNTRQAPVCVSGRDLITGVPSQKDIPVRLVRSAMKETLEMYVEVIRSMIGRTPPDVRSAIMEKGICLTGGMANMNGMSAYLKKYTGLSVKKVRDPELCAVKGLRKIISDRSYYKQLTYPMYGEDGRWLR